MAKKQTKSKKSPADETTSASVVPEGTILNKNEVTEEQSEIKENGEANVVKKKSTNKKGKTTKAAKPSVPPERKSTRAPKPVIKEGDQNKDYEVEKIVDVRTVQGKTEYLVRWKGYSRGDDTWEEEDDLGCCQELLQEFKLLQKSTVNKQNSSKKRAASKSPAKTPAKKKAKSMKKPETNYEVEEVVGMRVKNGKKEFKIRWKGFKPSEDTWEPEKNLSCEDLIKNYMEKHQDGTEEEDPKEEDTAEEEVKSAETKSPTKKTTRTKSTPKGKGKKSKKNK